MCADRALSHEEQKGEKSYKMSFFWEVLGEQAQTLNTVKNYFPLLGT